MHYKLIGSIAFLFVVIFAPAQDYSIAVVVKNQPKHQVLLGKVSGDNFIPLDSLLAESEMLRFQVDKNEGPAVFRLMLGEPAENNESEETEPRKCDFIFNAENVVLKTDFLAPVENLEILESKENLFWYNFILRDNLLLQGVSALEREMENHWVKKDTIADNTAADEFNRFKMERNMFIEELVKENAGLYASKIIEFSKIPVMDGYLGGEERIELLKKQFFAGLKFDNEDLIYSQVYTDKIFDFLVLFNEPWEKEEVREMEYKKAVDTVLKQLATNIKVKDFVVNYLIHGFEVLEMQGVIEHIKSSSRK